MNLYQAADYYETKADNILDHQFALEKLAEEVKHEEMRQHLTDAITSLKAAFHVAMNEEEKYKSIQAELEKLFG